MNRLALLVAAVAVPVSLAACSARPGDEVGSSSEELGILVHLPTAIGGEDRYTHYTPHTTATHVFPVGLVPSAKGSSSGSGLKVMGNGSSPPTTMDLSSWAPSPGDQGQTGSCAAWATGYSSMGWWYAKSGLSGAPFAPMYLYSQEVRGSCDQGTSIEGNMEILQQQGIDTAADYQPMQNNLDCSTQPNSQQRANAANYKISGYQQLDLSGSPQQAIEQALASGIPVVLGILAYDELMNATAQNYLIGPPSSGSQLYGGHAITAMKYDSNGVWILNSWTTGWGYQGWGELSWSFVNGSHNGQANVMDAAAITGVVGGGGGNNPPPPPPPPPPPQGGPTVTFSSPQDGSTVAPGASVSIVVSATDSSSSIQSAQLDWLSPAGHSQFALQSMGGDQWGLTLNLSSQAKPGTRTLTVTVTDQSGQSAQAQESVQVQ